MWPLTLRTWRWRCSCQRASFNWQLLYQKKERITYRWGSMFWRIHRATSLHWSSVKASAAMVVVTWISSCHVPLCRAVLGSLCMGVRTDWSTHTRACKGRRRGKCSTKTTAMLPQGRRVRRSTDQSKCTSHIVFTLESNANNTFHALRKFNGNYQIILRFLFFPTGKESTKEHSTEMRALTGTGAAAARRSAKHLEARRRTIQQSVATWPQSQKIVCYKRCAAI